MSTGISVSDPGPAKRDGRRRIEQPTSWLLWGSAALLVLFASFGGGSNELDRPGAIPLRLVSLVVLVLLAWRAARAPLARSRTGLVFFGLCAVVVGLQLVPLPPAVWAALPGREYYARLAADLGTASVWRPISISPDRTFDSLLHLMPVAATFFLVIALGDRNRDKVTYGILGFAFASGALGLLQVLSQSGSLALYDERFAGVASGFLANRNHQATLLSMMLPVLAWWARQQATKLGARSRLGVAACLGLLLVVMILITRSRSGVLTLGVGLIASAAILNLRNWRWAAAAAALAITLVFALGLDQRFAAESVAEDRRVQYISIVLKMTTDAFPVGQGFGTFDPAFRHYQPASSLKLSYFNRAHNDLLEIGVEGGLASYALLVCVLAWLGKRTLQAWRGQNSLQRALAAALVIPLIASLFDYPLRAPLFAMVCAALGALLELGRNREDTAAGLTHARGLATAGNRERVTG